jgi:hypothetical protein
VASSLTNVNLFMNEALMAQRCVNNPDMVFERSLLMSFSFFRNWKITAWQTRVYISYSVYARVQIFGKDSNKSNLHSRRC